MRTRSKLILAGLTATLFMGLAVSSASANKLSITNLRFRITWANLRFFTEGGAINPAVECPVTLEGSFHSTTISKVQRALIGYVTRTRSLGESETCGAGTAMFLPESLPWHVTYDGFRGTLPNITVLNVAVHGIAARLRTITACLYRDMGAAAETMRLELTREAGGNLTVVTPDTTRQIALVEPETCPPRMGFANRGELFLLGNVTRIRLVLI